VNLAAAEDESDVAKVLSGNVSAFEGIVRRWQGPLINLAYRFFRDRGGAEDMAQEAFMRAFRTLGTWRKEAAFSTWLFALATNLYRTELRRMPTRTTPLDELFDLPDLHDGRIELENEYRDRAVRKAVSALPPKYKEVLILFYFHDMDIATAARSRNLPEGTFKARMFRAREILREKLK
jgi:RNA polymerase sigma-70 factor (ECF subfamily)